MAMQPAMAHQNGSGVWLYNPLPATASQISSKEATERAAHSTARNTVLVPIFQETKVMIVKELGITQTSVWILPLNDWDDRTPEKRRWQPLRGPQRKPTISDYTDLTKVCHKWRISTWRQPLQPLQPWTSVESRTHRWAPETDLQWGPRYLDIHRGKTPGSSGPLTLWICCSWNKLLIHLAGGELAPRLSLVSPKVFSPFCHRWSFRSLPLSPLACSVGDTSFPAQSSTWLHRYYKLN